MNKNTVMPRFRSFFQNRTGLTALGLLLTILLSACGSPAAPQPTEAVPAQVATDVAATLTAQPTATSTATPTLTPTPTTTPTITPTVGIPVSGGVFSPSSVCNSATFVKDVSIPDGTVLAPGERFTKTWRLRNTGTCNWLSDYSLVFVGGDNMSGSNVSLGRTVDTNKNDEISVRLTAPDAVGTYTGFWRMADQFGNTFGDTIFVTIVVGEEVVVTSPPAVTVVVTATPAATSTPVPTHTPRPTRTPSP